MMSEEEQDSSGGVVFCSAEFAEKLDDFSDLFKKHKQPMAEAERFAMAIGIVKNSRLPKDEWKEGKKKRKGTQGLSTFEEGGKYNFRILFEMLDLWDEDDDVSLTLTISEYITGGMKWLTENEMIDGSKFSILKEEFPDLFLNENN
jgi:hypothetical protein